MTTANNVTRDSLVKITDSTPRRAVGRNTTFNSLSKASSSTLLLTENR